MPAPRPVEPLAFMFRDDGAIPNNPELPLVLYRGALGLSGARDPARRIETLFERNGWGGMWRNGIYPFVHYHSQTHEALGVARGRATVRFGGDKGQELDIGAGDVALLPAGTGHHGPWVSPDFLVIGAYPPDGRYDLCRGSKAEHDRALQTIPQVSLPEADPVYGAGGPLLGLWRK